MKVKRVLGSLAAAGTLTAASFGFAVAAQAAGTTVSITQAGTGQPEQGMVPISVSASCSDLGCQITSISVTIKDARNNVAGSNSVAPAGGSTSGSLNYPWNSATGKINGTYTVNASAVEQPAQVPGLLPVPAQTYNASPASVTIDNPPVAPGNVKATLNPAANNTPLVTWDANPEGDILGYEIFRSGSSAAPFTSTTNSFQDTTAPTGTPISYIVVAVRSSPVYASGITSCGAAAPCADPAKGGSAETAALTVPAPPPAAQQPSSVATADPPKPVVQTKTGSGTLPTTPALQPLTFANQKPATIVGPVLPTTVIQQPEPNVVQFAPLLPYSGKIPEVAVSSNVPAPVQATGGPQAASVALPGVGKVKTVDAVRYVAAAAVLIVGAVHLTRFARRLTAAT